MSLRDEILAGGFDLANRDDGAIAAALSQGRTKVVSREVGDGAIALAPVRMLDLGRSPAVIREEDLLSPARITWSDRIENDITLRYRSSTDGDFSRALQANSSNNLYCKRSVAQIREVRSVAVEAGWLRDDDAATRFLSDLARIQARPRRVLELSCTFAELAAEGDLIEFMPAGSSAGEGISARITQRTADDGWPSFVAEEILD